MDEGGRESSTHLHEAESFPESLSRTNFIRPISKSTRTRYRQTHLGNSRLTTRPPELSLSFHDLARLRIDPYLAGLVNSIDDFHLVHHAAA